VLRQYQNQINIVSESQQDPIYERFRKYLEAEWVAKSKEPQRRFTHLNLPGFSLELPKQNNAIDCGVFLIKYVIQFCSKPPTDFSNKETLNKEMGRAWFDTSEISQLRLTIKDTITNLMNNNNSNNNINCFDINQSYKKKNDDEERTESLEKDTDDIQSDHSNNKIDFELVYDTAKSSDSESKDNAKLEETNVDSVSISPESSEPIDSLENQLLQNIEIEKEEEKPQQKTEKEMEKEHKNEKEKQNQLQLQSQPDKEKEQKQLQQKQQQKN